MAKHRRHRQHYRRHRVSGIGNNDALQMILGGVGGYIAGNAINVKLTTLDPKIKAAVEIAAPVVLSKKLKSALLKGVGVGLAIAGAKQAGGAFGIAMLSGMPVVAGMPVVNGYVGYRRRVGNYVGGSADQPFLRNNAAGNNILSGVPQKKLSKEEIYAGAMIPNYNEN